MEQEKDIMPNSGTDEQNNSGNSKRSNGKKKRIEKLSARNFKIIDRRFLQKRELFPGIIVLAKPLSARIKVKTELNVEILNDVLTSALMKWSSHVDYSEIRALKGLMGLPSSASDVQAIKLTSQRLTVSTHSLLKACKDEGNLGMLLFKQGKGELILPKMIFDLLLLNDSMNKMHQPQFLERSQFIFENDYTHVCNENDGLKKSFEKTYKDFGDWTLNMEDALFFLNRFSHLTNFMPSQAMSVFDIINHSSPFIMNLFVSKTNSKSITYSIGQHATALDLTLGTILRTEIVDLGLENYHLDTYSYILPKDQVVNGCKRVILEEYCGIKDAFVSPTTLAAIEEIYTVSSDQITSV